MVLLISVRGEGKCEKVYKKKEKKIFPPFGRFFNHFWSLVCRKRLLGSVSGVRRRSREKKKCNLKKKMLGAFFRHYGLEKRSVCG